MAIDQLQYTWARKGLVGLDGFQPVAASDGLLRSPTMWSFATALCRFDKPVSAATPAPSVGWITLRGVRCVFARTSSGRDGYGRPGNLAAHVLVGPSHELTGGLALAVLNMRSYWTGMDPDTEVPPVLPRLEAADLRRMIDGDSAGSSDLSPALVRAVMSGRASVLDESPEEMLGGLRALDRRYPGALDSLSFSTYERFSSVAHIELGARPFLSYFRLVGSGAEVSRDDARAYGFEFVDGHWRGDLEVEQVTAALHISTPLAAKSLERSWRSLPATPNRLGLFKRQARVVALTERGEDATSADLNGLLAEAGLTQELLVFPQLRSLVARGFIAGDGDIAGSLPGVFAALSEDTQVALTQDLARYCWELPPQQLADCTQRVAALGPAAGSLFAAACLEESARFKTQPRQWPRNLVVLALTVVGPDDDWPEGLEFRAFGMITEVATQVAVSDTHFARLWLHGVRAGGDGLAAAIAARPERLPALVRQLGAPAVVSALSPLADHATVLRILLDSGVPLGHDILAWAGPVLASQHVTQRMEDVLRLQSRVERPSAAWANLVGEAVEASVVADCGDVHRRIDTARILDLDASLLRGTNAGAWRDLVNLMTSRQPRAEQMGETPLGVRESMRDTAAAFAIELLMIHQSRLLSQNYVLEQLEIHGRLTATEGARAMLRAGERGCVAYRSVTPAATAIRNIYWHVAIERLRVRRQRLRVVLEEPELQKRAVMMSTLARNMVPPHLFHAKVFGQLGADSEAARRWIETLL